VRDMYKSKPWALKTLIEGIKNCASYTELTYYSEVPTFYYAENGDVYYAKYRLRPINDAIDVTTGAIDEDLYRSKYYGYDYIPRQEGDDRSPTYLRDEFKTKLQSEALTPIEYKLEVQLHTTTGPTADDSTILDCCFNWDENEFPWKIIGNIRLDQFVPDEEGEKKLHFNPSFTHPDLPVIRAQSAHEPTSVMHMRCIVYEEMAKVQSSDSKLLAAAGLFTDLISNKIVNAIKGNTIDAGDIASSDEVYVIVVKTGNQKEAGTDGTCSLRHTDLLFIYLFFYLIYLFL
jgi:hypothetical protein